ncbi:hypothetical protein EUX98_g8437 [Antrodiella citrinella]|uniref:Uncharacterized protein n=1 Tax=Antrodiella citrinella TaxID=2447956 RepID=A0A4S4M7N8_9APHY|nr:hypothetical protein EUX98_g8437 [Antrodiella citrinella]
MLDDHPQTVLRLSQVSQDAPTTQASSIPNPELQKATQADIEGLVNKIREIRDGDLRVTQEAY